jgi:predicted Zn-dependent peptidase
MVMLSNGLRALGYEDRSTNLVGVFLALKVPAGAETPDLHGARDLLQEAFRYSLEQQLRGDPQYLDLTSALLSDHGLDLGTEWDYLSVSVLCPRSELRPLLALLGRTIFRDPLTPEAVAAAKLQTAHQWESYQGSPEEATYYLFRRALLGPEPAAQPIYPEPAAAAALTLAQLEAFRAQWFVPANAVLVLAGPDQPEQLVADAVAALVSLPKGPAPTGWPPPFAMQPSRVLVAGNPRLRQGNVQTASLIMGYRFPPPSDTDYAAGLVLFEMLEGKQGALETNQALRDALAAGAWTRPGATTLPLQLFGPTPSAVPYVAVHVQTNPGAIGTVHAALADAIAGVRAQFSDPVALERAKRRALDAEALAGLNQGARARRLGQWALFAQGWQDFRDLPAYVQAVKPADLRRVANRCLNREYAGVQMPE